MMTFILKMKKSRYNICSFRLEGSNEEDAVPMGKMDEMILVAPRDDVFKKESLTFQGVYSEDSRVAEIMAQIEAAYREMRRG